MMRLQKFVEQAPSGESLGRAAYVLNPATLPEPTPGLEWMPIPNFNAADHILNDPSLKDVFKAAISQGFR